MTETDPGTILREGKEGPSQEQLLSFVQNLSLTSKDIELFQSISRISKAMEEAKLFSTARSDAAFEADEAPANTTSNSMENLPKKSPQRGKAMGGNDSRLPPSSGPADLERACSELYHQFDRAQSGFSSLGGTRTVVAKFTCAQKHLRDLPTSSNKLFKSNDSGSQVRHMRDISEALKYLRTDLLDIERFFNSWDTFSSFRNTNLRFMIDLLSKCGKGLNSALDDQNGMVEVEERSKRAHDALVVEVLPALLGGMSRMALETKVIVESRIPYARAIEDNDITRYLTMTTIATFFSGITATTLQTSQSFSESNSALSNAVNLFWFLSLLFSISSAINSLLGMTWRKSSIPPPTLNLPKWATFWINKAPMIFLLVAAFAFIIGLVLFAFLSNQDILVPVFNVVFVVLHILGLLFLTSLFLLELKKNNKLVKRGKTLLASIRKRAGKASRLVRLKFRSFYKVIMARSIHSASKRRRLQISRNADYIVSFSPESVEPLNIYRIQDQCLQQLEVSCPSTVMQIACSPSGESFVAVGKHNVYLCSRESGECNLVEEDSSYRHHCVNWLPSGELFLSVGSGTALWHSSSGKQIPNQSSTTYATLYFAVPLSRSRYVALAKDNNRSIKQLRIKDDYTNTYLNVATVTDGSASITVARKGDPLDIILSFDDKNPPQIWRVGIHEDHAHDYLHIEEVYKQAKKLQDCEGSFSSNFVGSSTFGGPDEQFVLSATSDNNLYVWSRESGKLVQRIYPQTKREGNNTLIPRCITWTSNEASIQIGIGYSDGSVEFGIVRYDGEGAPTETSSPFVSLGLHSNPEKRGLPSMSNVFAAFPFARPLSYRHRAPNSAVDQEMGIVSDDRPKNDNEQTPLAEKPASPAIGFEKDDHKSKPLPSSSGAESTKDKVESELVSPDILVEEK